MACYKNCISLTQHPVRGVLGLQAQSYVNNNNDNFNSQNNKNHIFEIAFLAYFDNGPPASHLIFTMSNIEHMQL